jgi:hypothetical protein
MGLDAATLALKENCITSLQMLSDRHLAVVPESLQKRQEEERLAARREKRRLRREAVIAIEETPHEVEVAKVHKQQKWLLRDKKRCEMRIRAEYEMKLHSMSIEEMLR